MPHPDHPGEELINLTDQSLLNRYRRGDGDAATQLYLRYAERLRNMAIANTSNELRQRVDQDDVVQSVFRTFFRRVSKGQYDAPEGDVLWKLLLVIGLNKIRAMATYHRAGKRDIGKTVASDVQFELLDKGQSSDMGLTVLQMTIEELLSQMPDQYREIVDRRIAGYEVAEIAQMTNRSKRTVERILQAFRERLHSLVDLGE